MSTKSLAGSPPTAATHFAVIPFLRYADATAAARWLVDALGFTVGELYPSAAEVQHGELRFGTDGMIMIGPRKEDVLDVRLPREAGGSTHGVSLVVDDPDAHHARAVAAGAEVVRPLTDTEYGARAYTCRDADGHLWTVGTYRAAFGSRVSPGLRYEDAHAAIAWLRDAFGLEPNLVVPAPDGGVAHAELVWRTPQASGVVMLGSRRDDRLGTTTARRLGAVTQGIYVPVPDADAHHGRAIAAGASIVHPLADMPYGSREYSCRDLEGNPWSFGTYLA